MMTVAPLFVVLSVSAAPAPGGPCSATGLGQPNAGAANAAVARIGAERAAFLGAVADVAKCAKTRGEQLQGWTVAATRYYSDGSVEVDVSAVGAGKAGKTPIVVIGSGAANLDGSASTVARARIDAERAAQLEAKRNYAQSVQHAVPEGEAGDLRNRLSGHVKDCRLQKVMYFADGGVSIRLECGGEAGAAASVERSDAQLVSR